MFLFKSSKAAERQEQEKVALELERRRIEGIKVFGTIEERRKTARLNVLKVSEKDKKYILPCPDRREDDLPKMMEDMSLTVNTTNERVRNLCEPERPPSEYAQLTETVADLAAKIDFLTALVQTLKIEMSLWTRQVKGVDDDFKGNGL